jgi:hypothetical protein
MTKEQAAAEVKAQLKAGKNLVEITVAAKAVGVPAADLTTALIQAGQNPVTVAQAVAFTNPEQAAAINRAAAEAAPTLAAQIEQAILTVPAVNPSEVLKETAVGRDDRQVEVAPQVEQQLLQQQLPPIVAENPSQAGSPN